jgi:hypothetical protein
VIVTEALVGEMVMDIPEVVTVTVTAALADFVLSASLMTVTVCDPAVPGAVYSPPVETVPTVEFPPTTPSTRHCLPWFVVLVIVTVNCCFALTASVAEVGLMLTPTIALVTVTAELADLLGSALLMIFTVCEPAVAGAV